MALDPALRATLNLTAYRAAQSGVSSAGDPSFGTPAAILVRVEATPKLVRNVAGEEVVSTAQLVTETACLVTDRIWLPGLATTADLARRPLSVATAYDENGAVSHYEVAV